jgi:hydroxymethylpyrimidine/phosphomethylpyrimidine kinase
MSIPVVLTIAGSDSGGGAGIQADIKAMQANGVFATSVVTAVTAQNSVAVTDSMDLPISLISSQIDAVLSDFPVAGIKTGMLSSSAIIECIAAKLRDVSDIPIVIDPVMVSKSGYSLLKDNAVSALIDLILPLATVCTPNAQEAGRLVGFDVISESQAKKAAEIIHKMGPSNVLIKGGHLEAESDAVDILFDGSEMYVFRSPWINTNNTHGTGCTYASTIAANLAKGVPVPKAVEMAKEYVTNAIFFGFAFGKGHGPTDHFYFLRKPQK